MRKKILFSLSLLSVSVHAASSGNLVQETRTLPTGEDLHIYSAGSTIEMKRLGEILAQRNTVVTLKNLSTYDEATLDYIAKYTFSDKDYLSKYDSLSLYAKDGNTVWLMPGAYGDEKIELMILKEAQEELSTLPSPPRSVAKNASSNVAFARTAVIRADPPPEWQGYFTIRRVVPTGFCEEPELDRASMAFRRTVEITANAFPQNPKDSYTLNYNRDTQPLSLAQAEMVGCADAVVDVKIYLSDPRTGAFPRELERNVELSYRGMLKSINEGGFIYEPEIGGNGISNLRGFVDEIRFVTAFSTSSGWKLNLENSYPVGNEYENYSSTSGTDKSTTKGFSLGAEALGNTSMGGSLGVTFSGGYDQSSTVTTSTSITCENELFLANTGEQGSNDNSVYYDEAEDLDKSKVFFTRLRLNRIGDPMKSGSQSAQEYNAGQRSVLDILDNAIALQVSLHENNTAEPPQLAGFLGSTRHAYPYTASSFRNPWGGSPGDLLPRQIKDGFMYTPTATYTERFTSQSNRTELIQPRMEVWYSLGYTGSYLGNFGYSWYLSPYTFNPQTSSVVFKMSPIDIDWLDQRLIPVKTMSLQTTAGVSRYLNQQDDDAIFGKILS